MHLTSAARSDGRSQVIRCYPDDMGRYREGEWGSMFRHTGALLCVLLATAASGCCPCRVRTAPARASVAPRGPDCPGGAADDQVRRAVDALTSPDQSIANEAVAALWEKPVAKASLLCRLADTRPIRVSSMHFSTPGGVESAALYTPRVLADVLLTVLAGTYDRPGGYPTTCFVANGATPEVRQECAEAWWRSVRP
jgi:hypothetical protein